MNAPPDVNAMQEKACCVVAPDYYIDTLHDPGTTREIIIKPVPNDTNLMFVICYFFVQLKYWRFLVLINACNRFVNL